MIHFGCKKPTRCVRVGQQIKEDRRIVSLSDKVYVRNNLAIDDVKQYAHTEDITNELKQISCTKDVRECGLA